MPILLAYHQPGFEHFVILTFMTAHLVVKEAASSGIWVRGNSNILHIYHMQQNYRTLGATKQPPFHYPLPYRESLPGYNHPNPPIQLF